MANIYLTDETQEEFDKALEEYNEKNALTDRSGYIKYLLKNRKK